MILAPTLSLNGSYGLATVEYNAVVVSGAGTAAANGTYSERGQENGKPYYNLVGEADSIIESGISWDGSNWNITNSVEDTEYASGEDVEFPWLVESWNIADGFAPVPTLTPTTV